MSVTARDARMVGSNRRRRGQSNVRGVTHARPMKRRRGSPGGSSSGYDISSTRRHAGVRVPSRLLERKVTITTLVFATKKVLA